MRRKRKKHIKTVTPIQLPELKEDLHSQRGHFPLNISLQDRITFSVLRNIRNNIQKIENISYELLIDQTWEWVVRYDDHDGKGPLHRHMRISLENQTDIQSTSGIKKYKNKDFELTWVCNDIRRNYLIYRKKLLTRSGLDLY